MRSFITSVIGLAFIAVGTNSAHATLVNVEVTGEVTQIDSALESFFSLGEPMTASLSYDSSAAPSGGGPLNAYYLGAITSLVFTVGSFSGELAPPINEIDIINHTLDRVSFYSSFNTSLPGLRSYRFFLGLTDVSGTVFDTLTLPTSIDVADFNLGHSHLLFFDPDGRSHHVISNVFGLTPPPPPPTPSPEPTTLALFVLGLAGLVFTRRRIKA